MVNVCARRACSKSSIPIGTLDTSWSKCLEIEFCYEDDENSDRNGQGYLCVIT